MAKFRDKPQRVQFYDTVVSTSSELNGFDLDEFILKLTQLKKKHEDNATIDVSVDSEGCYNYCDFSISVVSSRMETPEEVEERRKTWQQQEKNMRDAAKERKKFREENDRKTYERLKKKFGKSK